MRGIDAELVPPSGAVILAPNHSSFMDHFLIGASIRRKVQFMAKSQLFKPPMQFIYTHGGVFPVRRGHRDEETFITALTVLDGGGCVAMYCEGGRSRTGRIGDTARPGIGRLALESGAPIVPIAVHGSSRVRNWRRLQFPKVTVQYGEPFRYERIAEPTRDQQQAVADAILGEIRTSTTRSRRRAAPARSRAPAPSGVRGAPSGPPLRSGYSPDPAGMMAGVRRTIVLTIAVLAIISAPAHAATVTLAKVGDFASPVYVTAPLGDTGRVFVVEQGGTVELVKGGATSSFLDLTSKVDLRRRARPALDRLPPRLRDERAVLRLLHGEEPARPDHHRRAPRRPREPRSADPSYARPLVTIPHDQQANHNGGQLQFGPDGALYAGTGDGGGGGDPSGNGQDTAVAPPSIDMADSVNHDYRLGKVLRIDPATGAVTIFAYGLRNPWRFSFDRTTGDLIIGDVGQEALQGGRLRRGARRRRGGQLRLEHVRGPAHLSAATWRRARAGHGAAGHRVPARSRVLDHGRLRGARPRAARARRHLPLRRQLHRRHHRRHAPGGHHARAGPQRPERGGLRRGRLRARLCGLARRAPSTASPAAAHAPGPRRSSAGCPPGSPRARPRPAPTPRAGVHPPARRGAPARAAHRLRRRQRALRRAVHRERGGRVVIARTAHAAAAPVLRTRTARATLVAGTRTTLRLKLSKATRGAIRRSLARPGRRATVRVSVRAVDAAGNVRTETRRVRIVR